METILSKIDEEHVFSTSLNPTKDSLTLLEECDHYYSINLNKEEVKELIEEITAIHNEMI